MWSLIVGFLLPPVLAIVQQTNWPDQLRAVVAFVACAAAGVGVAYFQGDLTGKRFVTAGLIVLTTALATYKSFWKPTGVAPTIETRTNFV
jgi:hypothetical protein